MDHIFVTQPDPTQEFPDPTRPSKDRPFTTIELNGYLSLQGASSVTVADVG